MIKNFKIKTDYKGRGYKYNRAYVKKNLSKFIPFSKGSHISKWDDDYWHGNKKIYNYIEKFLLKNVGNDINDVFKKFSKLGFRTSEEMYSMWEEYIEDRTSIEYKLYKYGYIYGFYSDENNTLQHKYWNKHNGKHYVSFTEEQLLWNEKNSMKIQSFGKVRNEPKKNLIGIAKKMRYLSDFYVIYKGEILRLPVYHIPFAEINMYEAYKIGTNDYLRNKRFEENYKHVVIPLIKGNLTLSNDWYGYYSGKEMIRNEEGKCEYVQKTMVGNLGYGHINTHIIIAQAEKEYEKTMFKKRFSEI